MFRANPVRPLGYTPSIFRLRSSSQDKWLKQLIARGDPTPLIVTQFRGARKSTTARYLGWYTGGIFVTVPPAPGLRLINRVQYVNNDRIEQYFAYSASWNGWFKERVVGLALATFVGIGGWLWARRGESQGDGHSNGIATPATNSVGSLRLKIDDTVTSWLFFAAAFALCCGASMIRKRTVIFDDVTRIPNAFKAGPRAYLRSALLKRIEGYGGDGRVNVIFLSSNDGLHWAFEDTNDSVRRVYAFPPPTPTEVAAAVLDSTKLTLTNEVLEENRRLLGLHIAYSVRAYNTTTKFAELSRKDLLRLATTLDLEASPTFKHLALALSPKVQLSDYMELATRLTFLNGRENFKVRFVPNPISDSEAFTSTNSGRLEVETRAWQPWVTLNPDATDPKVILDRAAAVCGGDSVPRRLALTVLLIASSTSLSELEVLQDLLAVTPEEDDCRYNYVERECVAFIRRLRASIDFALLNKTNKRAADWVTRANVPHDRLANLTMTTAGYFNAAAVNPATPSDLDNYVAEIVNIFKLN